MLNASSYLISTGLFTNNLVCFIASLANFSQSSKFIPISLNLTGKFNSIQRLLRLNNRKAIETNFNAFLVRSGERNILIDAGAGNLFGPVAGNLRYALSEVGVQNDEITDIVVTHLHPDHIGGLLSEQGDPVC